MSKVIPFPLRDADASAEWLVDIREDDLLHWQVNILRNGICIKSETFGLYIQALAAARILEVLHGFESCSPGYMSEPF